MSQELAQTGPNPLAALLSDTERLKEIPVDTVERLFEMDRRMRADAAREAFHAAMSRVQSKMEPVHRAAHNPQTRSQYARAEDVTKMLLPLLNEEGISYSESTEPAQVQDTIRVVLILRYQGHEERHYLDAPYDDMGMKGSKTKTRLHGMGSTLTYSWRYLLCMVFGVQLVKDDDGRGGSPSITEEQAADLKTLAEDVGADIPKFLAWLDVEGFDKVPADRYREAIGALERKRRSA